MTTPYRFTHRFPPYRPDDRWYYGGKHTPALVTANTGTLTLGAARNPDGTYLSSAITTPPFLYGRVTVMAKLPPGRGMWPALWLLTADSTGARGEPEIDLLEVPQTVDADRSVAHFGYHWTDPGGAAWQITATVPVPDMTAGFHRYTLDWQPDHVAWAVDDVELWRVTTDPAATPGHPVQWQQGAYQRATPSAIPIHATPLVLLITNGVGKAGAWAPAPDATTPFPNALTVDSLDIC